MNLNKTVLTKTLLISGLRAASENLPRRSSSFRWLSDDSEPFFNNFSKEFNVHNNPPELGNQMCASVHEFQWSNANCWESLFVLCG